MSDSEHSAAEFMGADLRARVIDGLLTHTHAVKDGSDQTIVTQPLRYLIQQTKYGLDVTLLGVEGEEAASVFLELDGDGKTPVVRIWDGEQGMGNDPVYTRRLNMEEYHG